MANKGLKILTGVGVGVFALARGASEIARIPAMSSQTANVLTNITSWGATVGLGAAAVGTTVFAVKGLVHLVRLATSSNYREQVKQKKLERQQAKELQNENKKKKVKKQKVVKEPTPKVVADEKPVKEIKTVEEPKPQVKKTASSKAGGLYDKLGSEYQELYDSLMNKTKAETLFNGKSLSDVEKFVMYAQDYINEVRANVEAGKKISKKEQENLVNLAVVATKGNNYIAKFKKLNTPPAETISTEGVKDNIQNIFNRFRK